MYRLDFEGLMSVSNEGLSRQKSRVPALPGIAAISPDEAPSEIVFHDTRSVMWLERIKSALSGVMMGFVLIAIAAIVLFWNEGRAVQTARSLAEGADGIVSVTSGTVDPANQGRLVHLSGMLRPSHRIGDEDFFLKADAVRLVRKVQTYQWREETRSESKKSFAGSDEAATSHTYSKGWSESRLDSSRFKRPEGHQNPEPRYRPREILAPDTAIGAFTMKDSLLRRMVAPEDFVVPYEMIVHLRQRHGAGVHITDGRIYLGTDPSNPRVGDMIVSYTIARPQVISAIARQVGNELTEFQTSSGDHITMIVPGEVAAGPMFAQAERASAVSSWVLRCIGISLMCLGFALVGRPFADFADLIPLAGDILRVGLGFSALALTAFLAPTVIGLAWLWYRPLTSIVLISSGFAIITVFYLLSQASRRTRPI
jgi:Transmembrane protein 43